MKPVRTSLTLLLLCTGVGVLAQSADKKPNISVTGCLVAQGYATFIVEDARIDAVGDGAAAANPASKTNEAKKGEPQKWVLDGAGNVRTHVGERVQVVGVTDWKAGDPVPVEGPGPAAPTPHITVTSVKFLAPSCS